jgi:predicted dinucleotide-binding enzyme
VKAFNTIFAEKQADPRAGDTAFDGLVAGDDDAAKRVVLELVEKIGYRPIDAGPLSAARYLEGMAFLNIWLNVHNGWGRRSGWRLIGAGD